MKQSIKEIAVISGKGGTGKTTVAGSLAFIAKNKIMVDCDVDAADLHLILRGNSKQSTEFIGGQKAVINPQICIDCGICQEFCRFDAVKEREDGQFIMKYIDDLSCEGCGLCAEFCPNNAITLNDHISGEWFINKTKYGPLVHAKLGIAEANSGKLVSQLRRVTRDLATDAKNGMIIIDGSPGIGCPVIASLTGVDYALIVTEPTVSALHDMERLLELISHFGIRTGICINKYDINPTICKSITRVAKDKNLKVLAKIPYDTDIIKAQIKGVPLPEYKKDGVTQNIYNLWENLMSDIKTETTHH